MSKPLRTIAMIAGATALIATGIGAAAGAGLFGASVTATTGTIAGVATSTIGSIATYASPAPSVSSALELIT